MASDYILDLDDLLKPISEENPAGDDIRDNPSPSSHYYTIKDARNAARAAERNNMFDGDTSEADDHWRKVYELAPDILANHAKDLEIASWLTEAMARRFGFQGIRDSFKLIEGLVENYWDNLYPLPDEDGIETRVAPLTGLNGEGSEGVLIAPIRNISITEGYDPGPFSFWKYQQALDVEKIIDEESRSEKASKLGFSVDDIEKAVTSSSDTFFIGARDSLTEAIDTYRRIAAKLDEYCGVHDSPPYSNIINILEACLGAVNHIGRNKLPIEGAEESTEHESNEQGEAMSNNAPAQASGPIKTRDEAFKRITEIADYFRKSEPHSPISYILDRAVKWGSMPLEDLMRELIPDSSARDTYGSLTGIKTEDEY